MRRSAEVDYLRLIRNNEWDAEEIALIRWYAGTRERGALADGPLHLSAGLVAHDAARFYECLDGQIKSPKTFFASTGGVKEHLLRIRELSKGCPEQEHLKRPDKIEETDKTL